MMRVYTVDMPMITTQATKTAAMIFGVAANAQVPHCIQTMTDVIALPTAQ